MPQSMVHIENLVKRYGDLTALNHLDLDIREGEIFGLLGPNGSGKLLRVHFAEIFKTGKFNGILHQLFSPFPVPYVKAAEIIDVFLHCQLIKNGYILKHDPDLFLKLIAVRLHLFSEYLYFTSVIFQ